MIMYLTVKLKSGNEISGKFEGRFGNSLFLTSDNKQAAVKILNDADTRIAALSETTDGSFKVQITYDEIAGVEIDE